MRERACEMEMLRRHFMRLTEAEIALWDEHTPPRHALSALWGKMRDVDIGQSVRRRDEEDERRRSNGHPDLR